ncbi:MAG: hypothetical protein U0641_16720 [Anaerolineae bacterium]
MMLRDMTVLSRDTRSATGVFRLDGHRRPYYFVALRNPSGYFRVQRVYPNAPADASAAVSQALNGDGDNPPERRRGEAGCARRVCLAAPPLRVDMGWRFM